MSYEVPHAKKIDQFITLSCGTIPYFKSICDMVYPMHQSKSPKSSSTFAFVILQPSHDCGFKSQTLTFNIPADSPEYAANVEMELVSGYRYNACFSN